MESNEVLRDLAVKVDKILKEELEKSQIPFELAEARIYDVQTVGVQGDERTYGHPAEIILYNKGKFVWDRKFLETLSTRITNEIKEINKVVYVTEFKD